mmetsp:Transcript_2236/g.4075  ORF Transcript_2236/g.4075 Transcript_2236/m.4075 type:complete len:201 (-) Transcript_2236:95-697(-)
MLKVFPPRIRNISVVQNQMKDDATRVVELSIEILLSLVLCEYLLLSIVVLCVPFCQSNQHICLLQQQICPTTIHDCLEQMPPLQTSVLVFEMSIVIFASHVIHLQLSVSSFVLMRHHAHLLQRGLTATLYSLSNHSAGLTRGGPSQYLVRGMVAIDTFGSDSVVVKYDCLLVRHLHCLFVRNMKQLLCDVFLPTRFPTAK